MKKNTSSMLIVDDDMDVLKILRKVFEDSGLTVFAVPTGGSALAIIEKEKVDIVLLDIRLPDISGIDILKEIKRKYPNLPVIMLTGFGYDSELVNESVRLGAKGYVSKGTPIQELIEVINNALAS